MMHESIKAEILLRLMHKIMHNRALTFDFRYWALKQHIKLNNLTIKNR